MAFVARNMRVAARKAPARVDLPQYSDKAVFEALVNAVRTGTIQWAAAKIRPFDV